MSAVIKVCALDTSYLEVVVPHMVRQAKYPFAEVVLVADPRTTFTGKYARRSRSVDYGAYAATLDRLRANGVVHRIVWAEASTAEIEKTLNRYFSHPTEQGWSHDMTGAPVYSALLGLDSASSDLVLLMDADVLFHSSGSSWVDAGVTLLQDVGSIWFVMTHAGPPAGPAGTQESLGPGNHGNAAWDEQHGVWRFRHASSRYFLTDRRRLRGAVEVVREFGGLAPLEKCFSATLRHRNACRANLAIDGSWDLHVEHHEDPFPAWAAHIAALVERGLVPERQRGNYDLNLRRRAERLPWRALLEREFPDFRATG